MATMSRYCKAYAIDALRAFEGWKENIPVERPAAGVVDDAEVDREASAEAEDAVKGTYVFLHENYHVTADVFVDEQVVFDAVSPEWMAFCAQQLEFSVPDDVIAASEQAMEV